MKSFVPRSQRDRTFDRLVQQASNNHAALISRSVPLCKTSPSKAPSVIQRPVSPRKCVTITTFVGDDDGDTFEDGSKSEKSPNRKEKIYSMSRESPDDLSSKDARTTRPAYSSSKVGGQEPLRVTFRLQKVSVPKTGVSKSDPVSPATGDDREGSTDRPLNSAPLTLSLKRRSEASSGSSRWIVASSSSSASETSRTSVEFGKDQQKCESPLSSPPIIRAKSSVPSSDVTVISQHGTKRKTGTEVDHLTFAFGGEERGLPKRRMLHHPNTVTPSTSSAGPVASALPDYALPEDKASKARSVNALSQKILMTKTQSLPVESGSSDGGCKKKPSLLKRSSTTMTANRKAIYNPRQWINRDLEEEPASTADKKQASGAKASSAFDFDSDEEQSSDRSPSPPRARPAVAPKAAAPEQRRPEPGRASGAAAAAPVAPPSKVPAKAAVAAPSKSAAASGAAPAGPGPVRVERETKALYTVVRNVKEAHECQESGETQDLLDDVEYMVDGLKKTESPATRCLSLLRLCKECMSQEFRMALKAHGLLPRIIANISDASSEGCDSGVTLHTAALLFILSRDKLAAGDLDKAGLQLLLRLLRCDAKGLNLQQARELDRTRGRLRSVIEQVTKANAKSANYSYLRGLHNTRFTAKDLAAESLLNLSVRKASDWFKNELRKEGGLDHFCGATIVAMEYFNNELESQELTEFMLERLRRIEQYMRLLENMTYMNGANQEYLVQFGERTFLDSIAACLRLCVNNMRREMKVDAPTTKVLVACLLAIWRVLLNISHDNEKCSDRLGAHPLLVALSLHCVLRLPRRLPPHRRFDLLVLSLGFLVNLVEHCDENRSRLAYTSVRLPWRKPKKQRVRRGLVLKPKASHSDSSSSSSEGDESSSSEDEEDRPKTALDELVKFFLERYEASERLELEQQTDGGEAEPGVDAKAEEAPQGEEEESEGMKWRLIEDKQLERQRRGRHRPLQLPERKRSDSDGEPEDSDSDSGADVEFMPSTQEESAALESALSRAGEHMEASMTASYVALLLGCVMRGSRRRVDRVQTRLPDGRFRPLALSLAKFLGFMSLTSAVGQAGGKSMLEVVHFLHELDGDDPNESLPADPKSASKDS